jgi:hypothetical protein
MSPFIWGILSLKKSQLASKSSPIGEKSKNLVTLAGAYKSGAPFGVFIPKKV